MLLHSATHVWGVFEKNVMVLPLVVWPVGCYCVFFPIVLYSY